MRINAPKGVLNQALRAQIAEHKAALLTFLTNAETSIANIPPPISRRIPKTPARLSFAQERLWFLEQFETGADVYNISRASRLTGKLNIAALEASLNEIVRRHEVLRSAIRVVDGLPVQVVAKESPAKLNIIDLQDLCGEEREIGVRRRIQEEALRPFDFAAGQFLRAALFRIADREHVLVLTTHHIVSDAWSMGILMRELWTLYEAFANDEVSRLDELPVQYADFAVWQKKWLQGEVLESQLSYWKKQLADISIINLPTDRARPPRQSFRGARVPIMLPEPLTAAVNNLSYRFNVTPFMALLAAFQVLLHRYSGQDDIAVGSPVANRRRSELESLIGFFVNTLVMRTDLSASPTFKELLSRVRDVCLGAYAHQDLPFEKLVEELKPERDQSRNPLFQVMFVLQNATKPLAPASGIRAEPIEIDNKRSQFDLSLFLREREGQLIGFIEYSTDLFDRDRIEHMAGHFQTLIEGIVADPDQPISMLPILTDSERHRILVEWNNTSADYPKDKCIHQLFEAQVERTPDAVAVEFDGEQLSYRELNRRANRLAHHLIGLGVGPETLVAICVERSLRMVVGLLAILKAGGGYVPLDPAYPRERLEFMLRDASCPVLLTLEGLIEDRGLRMDEGDPRSSVLEPRIKAVCLDRDWPVIAHESEETPKSGVDSNNLAYVIYTSGSTGTPKGVAIEHRNTVNLLHWATSVFTTAELAGVLASTSVCFDLSVFELFVPLSCGGKAILAGNALCLHELGNKQDITLVNMVPSVMSQVLALAPLPESVRIVNLAGEPLRSELVDKLYDHAHVEKVYDLYGPSETTTYSTFALRTKNGPTTIGRPIANTQIYLLDGILQPVPIGIPGELYIGGAGVARGYVNRPELTAERFMTKSLDGSSAKRLYRTGDLARYRSDGNIEFLGRTDNQVKIRGYRVELGEIEAVLTKHQAVKDCVLVAKERESRFGKQLLGYVVPEEHSVFSATALRSYLKEKLPDYMVPSLFVQLGAVPRTANGKVDRSKLPPPDANSSQTTREFVAPRNEIEQLISQVWKAVLRIESVGIHDNFFELGGHSLLAVQIISRLRNAFDREIPLRVLFEAPTVASLALIVEKFIREDSVPELPSIVPVPRDQPLPLSLNQEHLWNLDQMVPGAHFFNIPYVYHLRGDLNLGAFEKTLREIVRRHEALRTVFAKIDGRPVQIIKDGSDFQLLVEDLGSGLPDDVSERAAALILEERQRPFDLATGPLFRTNLLRLKDTEHLLLITMHHIIGDHWSTQVIRAELAVLYEAFSQGRSSPLPEPLIHFADVAFWERKSGETNFMKTQLVFWKKQLSGSLDKLEFPEKTDRKQDSDFQMSRAPVELDASLFSGIKSLAGSENCTPFMVLLTALSLVLFNATGETDIRIGTLVANRFQKETELIVGHLVNTVVLRIRVTSETAFISLLRQVRDITLAAYAHQELPFEQLAQALENERNINRASLFQVLFNYESYVPDCQVSAGLTFAPLDTREAGGDTELMPTTFDLIFNLRESSTALAGTVNYNTDSIGQEGVASILSFLVGLLETTVLGRRRI